MKENRLYGELSYLWPIISPPEEYADEASCWRDVLHEKLGVGQHDILELGVGGGHLLSHLTGDFKAAAVDVSQEMLGLSMRLNPGVEHHVGDMRTIRLGRTFGAVLIHDAASYMLTEENLRAAFATARAHLEHGGVLIVAPDWFRETFPGTSVAHRTCHKDGVEVTYIEYRHDPDPSDTTIETLFFYLITEEGVLRVEEDRHVMGLFPMETWLRLMREAGFEAERRPYPVHEDDREAYLLVGVLRK